MNPTTKTILGALVAAALAIAVYYGLIGQQTATNIQTQADRTLGTAPANQQTTTGQATMGQATTGATTTAGAPNPAATGTATPAAPPAPADTRPDAPAANGTAAPAH